MKGSVVVEGPISFGMIKIGYWNKSDPMDRVKGNHSIVYITGRLVFNGSAYIGIGSILDIRGLLQV